MGGIRVYLAIGEEGLRTLAQGGTLDPGSVPAAAVTTAARDAFPEDDEEELEYDALLVAAQLAGQAQPGGRVVVAAADVDPGAVEELAPGEGVDGFEVRLGTGVGRSQLVALHAAEHGAGEDDELLWYDVCELERLAAGEV